MDTTHWMKKKSREAQLCAKDVEGRFSTSFDMAAAVAASSLILRPLVTPQFATTRSSRVVRPRPTRGTVSIRAQAKQDPKPKNLMESMGRVISRRGLMSNLGTGALFAAWVYLGWDVVQVRLRDGERWTPEDLRRYRKAPEPGALRT